MAKLSDSITILKGVGPAKAKQFANLNIFTLRDLICHFPRGYEDRTKLVPIEKLEVDVPACFKAMVMNTPRTSHIRKGLDITKVQVADHTARLTLTFFNSKFVSDQLQYGREYIFYGAVSGDFIGFNMTNPAFESLDSQPVTTRRVLPIYPLTAGLNNGSVLRAVRQALAICDPPAEIIPEEVRQKYGILPAERAYYAIHEPASMAEAELAKKRLIFEEFFVFSAGLSLMRAARAEKRTAPYTNFEMRPFYASLPFTLTGAQQRAVEEILNDFRRGAPMNRLIQGDVGSGKTVVGAACAWLMAKNGFQSALMAPTEILAEQHYKTLSPLLEKSGHRVGLLTGSMLIKEKREIWARLEAGEIDLLIGTHALISEGVRFKKLGLVITDEQHRFGVGQRAALVGKGDEHDRPHVLVMSATPIPRTLALIVYGDLDVSIIDERPPGRQEVETVLVGEDKRQRMYGFVRKQVLEGHQVYLVCPAVEETEGTALLPGGMDLKAVTAYAQELQTQVFPDLRVGFIHGKLKAKEKETAMAAFSKGELDLLVATTVIEVGVDVPNATLIVIENAERFGLSQLHQLRGRVGRGRDKSYCVLVSSAQGQDARQRMKALCATNDGFRIAEEDLKLRGPGDFFGSRQHGLPPLKVADLAGDTRVLYEAKDAAQELLERDPELALPEHRGIRLKVEQLFEANRDTFN